MLATIAATTIPATQQNRVATEAQEKRAPCYKKQKQYARHSQYFVPSLETKPTSTHRLSLRIGYTRTFKVHVYSVHARTHPVTKTGKALLGAGQLETCQAASHVRKRRQRGNGSIWSPLHPRLLLAPAYGASQLLVAQTRMHL